MTDRSARLGAIFCMCLEMAFLNAAPVGYRAIHMNGHRAE